MKLPDGVRIQVSAYVPLAQPTKREMRLWRWWWRFWGRPKPQPVEQLVFIDGGRTVVMLPKTYERLKAEMAAPTNPGEKR